MGRVGRARRWEPVMGIQQLPQPHQRGAVTVGDLVALLDQLQQGLPLDRQDGRDGIEGGVPRGRLGRHNQDHTRLPRGVLGVWGCGCPTSAATLSSGPASRVPTLRHWRF